MKNKIAFDVTGLAWEYRTGVQNLYWAYIEAFSRHPNYIENCEIYFYDRSGIFNIQIDREIGQNYLSCTPRWLPKKSQKLMHRMLSRGLLPSPKLDGYINQVWNWDIYNPSGSVGSITIPDILPLEYPQWFSTDFQRQTERAISFAVNEAEFIQCISFDVKKRLLGLTGMDSKKIRVVYPGISQSFFESIPKILQEKILTKFHLTKNDYLISSGFLDPRKNLKRQIEAFGIFVRKHPTSLKYVLTGLKTNLSQEVLDLIEGPDLRDRVIFLGYVSAEDLLVLTSAAACVMYCSIAEGFGLPIIEAMALGVPIVTSNTSSMKELAQDRAILANPEDSESITNAIENTLQVSALQMQIRIDGNKKFASNFTIDSWFKGHIEQMLG